MCGVVGIISKQPVNQDIYDALTYYSIVDRMRQGLSPGMQAAYIRGKVMV